MSHNNKLSKKLSWLLRHGLVEENIKVRPDGYVFIRDVMKTSNFRGTSFKDIKNVVDNDEKKRFSLIEEKGVFLIRANQGHSLEVGKKLKEEELLTPLFKSYPICVHGTTKKNYELIKISGLKKMARTHIHFSICDDFIISNRQQSGIRSNSEVLIYLNMEKALEDGIKFFISDNKVILSPGIEGVIPVEYFQKVVIV